MGGGLPPSIKWMQGIEEDANDTDGFPPSLHSLAKISSRKK